MKKAPAEAGAFISFASLSCPLVEQDLLSSSLIGRRISSPMAMPLFTAAAPPLMRLRRLASPIMQFDGCVLDRHGDELLVTCEDESAEKLDVANS